MNSISKIGNGLVVENLFPKKMNLDLLESHHFCERTSLKIIGF